VPIVPLRNRPRLGCEGESELADIYRIQNQINGFLFLLALAGYFGAHRQRWAVGLKIMEDERPGSRSSRSTSRSTSCGRARTPTRSSASSKQTDLDGYIKAIEQKVLHIAVTSRTPRHYLIQEGQSPSGDAIKSPSPASSRRSSASSGRSARASRKSCDRAHDGRQGNPSVDSEVVWADADTESEAVITDAVVKQFEAGLIPWEAALEKLGYTQTQITRYSGMRAQDALMRRMLEPDVKNPGGGGEGS
jgi:hypothetical protein